MLKGTSEPMAGRKLLAVIFFRFSLPWLLALLVLLLLAWPLRASTYASQTFQAGSTTTEGLEFVGSLGGDVRAVALSDTLAYVGEGAALAILDVSNPAQPALRSRLPLPGIVRDLQVAGGLVYIANDEKGLSIVEASDPAKPALRGRYDTPGIAVGIYVTGSLAYLADEEGGLTILDVSDPVNPTQRGIYSGTIHDVWVEGNLAYLADGDLQILNVSDVTNPLPVGIYTTPGIALAVQTVGGLAFIADDYAGIQIVDVGSPMSPTLRGSYSGYWPNDISVMGNFAYVHSDGVDNLSSTAYCQIEILDVSDPSQPALQGGLERPSYSDCDGHLQVAGSQVYVADGRLQIIDVSVPVSPGIQGKYVPLRPLGAQVVGNMAYVADRESGLLILDVSDPLSPTILGGYSYGPPGITKDVQVVGDRAYVTTWLPSHPHFPQGELLIIDVNNPFSPTLLGSYSVTGIVDFYVVGGRAYVIDSVAGFPPQLEIVDISNPSSPTQIAPYWFCVNGLCIIRPFAIYSAGEFAYVITYDYPGVTGPELRVLNVSNAVSPTLSGSVVISGGNDLQVVNPLAYIVAESGGLQIIEVSDPASPTLLSTCEPPRDLGSVFS